MPTIPFLKNIRSDLKKKKKQQHLQTPVSVSQKIYNSQKWKKLRDAYIAEFPLCQSCLEKGKITPAEEVHHVQPFLTGQTQQEIEALAFEWNNLMSVCHQCHVELHKELRGYGHYSKKEKDK